MRSDIGYKSSNSIQSISLSLNEVDLEDGDWSSVVRLATTG